jgi:hypothetical protein
MELHEVPPAVPTPDVVPSTLACHDLRVGLDDDIVVVLYSAVILERQIILVIVGIP